MNPEHPEVFDRVQFEIDPGDPAGRWLAGGEVRFGDGASAEIPAVPGTATVWHKYAADGEYEVTITGYTADGRSGSTPQTVKVETHDVTVSNVGNVHEGVARTCLRTTLATIFRHA